ncbi:MAG: bifunctional phosphoribosylaminoimidazolecarboxamide formyltransferase/IMP cyclohydrolase [Solirubrobacterales bacterium]
MRRALLSVSDKEGIVEFARGLAGMGVEIVSTGGTAAALAEAGLEVRAIDDLTGFPEIMDGRVKTLNPRLYAGLLARRDDAAHMEQAEEHGIELVDLVCVNLYPFEETVARDGAGADEVIENIDIGGPTMVRAAAKNFAFSAIVTDPGQYGEVLEALTAGEGALALELRERLAAAAFALTARYDAAISSWFARRAGGFPPRLARSWEKRLELPYGENPHQAAAFYEEAGAASGVLADAAQLHGKELSFNNVLDLDGARGMLAELGDGEPACAIVKHNNPCGVARGATLLEAYRKAFAGDPVSAFGGIIALNRPVDAETAQALSEQFIEVLVAPGYEPAALETLTAKPDVRILEASGDGRPAAGSWELRPVAGGLLVQEHDSVVAARDGMEVVSAREPTEQEWLDLIFAWQVSRHVKSNAIVVARDQATLGIGAGQMSRVDSVKIALGREWIESTEGLVLASDAFFPFADGPQAAIAGGAGALIQPGGSIRDDEVIAAVDELGAAMVFTGRRHFRH